MLHDANLVAKSGKGEADEVGFSHMVKDAEYHTKETEGNVGLSRVITWSNLHFLNHCGA